MIRRRYSGEPVIRLDAKTCCVHVRLTVPSLPSHQWVVFIIGSIVTECQFSVYRLAGRPPWVVIAGLCLLYTAGSALAAWGLLALFQVSHFTLICLWGEGTPGVVEGELLGFAFMFLLGGVSFRECWCVVRDGNLEERLLARRDDCLYVRALR
jgi:hypothetical protein